MTRRPFQIGKASYRLEQRASGWWVVEEWWQIDRHGEKEDAHEDVAGPLTHEAARDAMAAFERKAR